LGLGAWGFGLGALIDMRGFSPFTIKPLENFQILLEILF
jgi:hypothetical protein